MTNIKIVTDSGAAISQNAVLNHNINVIKLPIYKNKQLFGYVNEMSTQKFVQLLNNTHTDLTIGQPDEDSLVNLYNDLGQDGSQILSIHLSSALTNTYEIAKKAAQRSHSHVTVVDSEVTAAGLAYQVENAAKDISKDLSIDKILSDLNHCRQNTRIIFSITDNSKLIKKKIIGKIRGKIESHLKVAYIFNFHDNQFDFIARSSQDKVLPNFWEKQLSQMHNQRIIELSVLHTGNDTKDRQIYNELKEEFPFVPISITEANPEIASFIGTNATGLTYLIDKIKPGD